MNKQRTTGLDNIMDALFEPYLKMVLDVKKITDAMVKEGMILDHSEIVNDHIAFRTLGLPNLGIASLEKIFLHYGYTKKSPYFFEKKKLNAYWYEPPSTHYPRIFISELRVEELSNSAQAIIKKYTKGITIDPVNLIDLDNTEEVKHFFYKPLWNLSTLSDYSSLLEESEYAAWVIYNRYYLNHFTISVHELPDPYCKLENFNEFLRSIGIVLNSSGGEIKTSKDGLLKQSSSVAKMIDAQFSDNQSKKISGSYVEFAERLVLPEFQELPKSKLKNEHRRDGFESSNADKIFESTYLKQTQQSK